MDFTPNIGYTVVYRIIALGTSVGKTTIGEQIVSYLSKRGVVVAVVKQTHEPQIDPDTDAGRYWSSGAKLVVVMSPSETVVYKEYMSGLREILYRMPFYYPVVIAEGFRGCNVGKAIAIIESEEELRNIAGEPGIWYIVSHDFSVVEEAKEMGLHALLFEETEALAGEVYKDALSTLLSLIPSSDCEVCGVGSCLELVEKLLTHEIMPTDCPLLTRTTIVVDGKPLTLDPLLENLMRNLVKAFLSSIKGAPTTVKKVRIDIEYPE